VQHHQSGHPCPAAQPSVIGVEARDGALHEGVRRELAKAFRAHGLRTLPHYSTDLAEPSIWVECRVDTCASDHALIYALLDAEGWRTNTERLSRVSQRYDVTRVRHIRTGATLALIVKHPSPDTPSWEAA
jgi:hypothetical protein